MTGGFKKLLLFGLGLRAANGEMSFRPELASNNTLVATCQSIHVHAPIYQ